jgi:predicted nuclease of restriction endonuclease-like (RecB) superfamily
LLRTANLLYAGMAKKRSRPTLQATTDDLPGYGTVLASISELLARARHSTAQAINSILTATYWEIGRRVVEFEQRGQARAAYGEQLWKRLADDLTARHGRGFSKSNIALMRSFYLQWEIFQTPSGKFAAQVKDSPFSPLPGRTAGESMDSQPAAAADVPDLVGAFRLPWSHYVQLLAVENSNARSFYEAEALRGGWSVRQLRRQIGSQFYERTALSRNKAGMLTTGRKARSDDAITPEQELKDPFVLEFLDLKDQYSESELEDALIQHMESFLLELGNDFAFIGRQKRLRVDDEWYRIDLVFFHRGLRALILIDLKLQKLTPGDIGQMNFYVNYAHEHWTRPDENPPVGLILCADHGGGVAKYALEGLPNKVLAARYRTALPSETLLVAEMDQTRKMLEGRSGDVSESEREE